MAGEQAQARGGGFKRFLVWVVLVVLVGAVGWLASERNQRHFTVESREGKLVVSRGRFFPTGNAEIEAADPVLGKLYAPIPMPQGAKAVPETTYDDQGALDRGLYDLLGGWARADAAKGTQEALAEADALAQRLSNLGGLTPTQLGDLATLRGDLAYTAALADLQTAARTVHAARQKLEESRRGGGQRSLEAGTLSQRLEPLENALLDVAGGRALASSLPAIPARAAADGGAPAGDAGVPDAGGAPDAGSGPDGGSTGAGEELLPSGMRSSGPGR